MIKILQGSFASYTR